MKRILAGLILIAFASTGFSAGTNTLPVNTALMINSTNFAIAFPTGATQRASFLTTNDIALRSVYVAATNALNIVDTNLQAQITAIQSTNGYATTNQYVAVSNRVTVLETNAATLAQYVAVSNRVTTLEATTMPPYSNGNITVTGTVTAVSFVGSGVGLTGVVASATGGVNQIVVGGVTNTGNVTFGGLRVSATAGTVVFTNVEYLSKTVVPSTATYEYEWFMPRDEPVTLLKAWGRADPFQVTFTVLCAPSNSLWRAGLVTNLANIVAATTGVEATNFTSATIPAGYWFGIRMEETSDTRATAFSYGLKIAY